MDSPTRPTWLRRGAVAALAATVLGTCGWVALTDPGAPEALRDAKPGADLRWATPDASVTQDAEDLLAEQAPAAGAATRLRIVVVSAKDQSPVVRVVPVTGRAAAGRAITAAQAAPDTVAVGVDTRVQLPPEPTSPAPATAAAGATVRGGARARTNDAYRASQWALNKLGAEHAWTVASGAGAVVAVIDTGVDATHPDLAGQVRPGVDFLGGNGADPTGDGHSDPHGHGTHVAGIIAAVKGNATGIAGLAPTADILPVRVLDADGSGWNSDVAAGIVWATNHGADVINMSLGGQEDSATKAAVEYAVGHGVVVVAAAGNERQNGNATSYPAAFPGVLAVAATTSTDTSAPFSNTGSYVDLAAPGNSILSTVPDSGYAIKSGTSMAAPYVAAAAAIVLDASDGTATPAQVANALLGTATDLGPAGRDDEFGAGLVNPYAAACAVTSCDPSTPTPPTPTPTPPTPTPSTPTPPTPTPTVPGGGDATPAPVRFVSPAPLSYLWSGAVTRVRVRLVTVAAGTPVGDEPVVIRGWRAGRVVLVRRTRTGARGEVALPVQLTRTTRFTVTHPRSGRFARSSAPVGTARVLPQVHATYSATTASVQVSPAAGQVMVLQRRVGAQWQVVRRVHTSRAGAATAAGLPAGVWRMHISAAAGLEDVYTASWTTR